MDIRCLSWQDGRFGYPYDSDQGRQSLLEMKEKIPSANYVLHDVRVRCADGTNTAEADPDTTLAELTYAVDYAKSLGYKNLVRIRLRNVASLTFVPPGIDTWFSNYANAVLYWAEFCSAHGVNDYAIANELSSPIMKRNDLWNSLISAVRIVYKGKVSYSGNWWYMIEDDGFKPQFRTHLEADWFKSLDYIGLSNYPNVISNASDYVHPETPSVDALIYGYENLPWYYLQGQNLMDMYKQLSVAHGKQILFYIGLGSYYGSFNTPWLASTGTVDWVGQANWFEAFYRLCDKQSWITGFSIDGGWRTISNQDPNNTDFSLINKPASDITQNWFKTFSPIVSDNMLLPLGLVAGLYIITRKK